MSFISLNAWRFVINEGGRGFTFTLYFKPFSVRIYLAGWVWNV
ncbi:MAG: hypothetical protein V4457_12825 [Pseudomonadota bacterium]